MEPLQLQEMLERFRNLPLIRNWRRQEELMEAISCNVFVVQKVKQPLEGYLHCTPADIVDRVQEKLDEIFKSPEDMLVAHTTYMSGGLFAYDEAHARHLLGLLRGHQAHMVFLSDMAGYHISEELQEFILADLRDQALCAHPSTEG